MWHSSILNMNINVQHCRSNRSYLFLFKYINLKYKLNDAKNPNRSVAALSLPISKRITLLSKSAVKDLKDAYFMKAQCHMELYNYDEAFKAFDTVIEIMPKNAKVNQRSKALISYYTVI
jgi:tetratricopeptide (TPR) repeat protein